MESRLSHALLVGLALAGPALAQTSAPPDSVAAFPSRVRHRSVAEELIALPGLAAYLPVHAFFFVGKYTAHAIWNERLLDRAKAWLTTAEGRAGIRPLGSTSIGTGGRVFYKDLLLDGDASLTSSWGASSRQRQYHFFVLSWPGGRPLPGKLKFVFQFRRSPHQSFYGLGHQTGKADRTSFFQEDLYVQLLYQDRLNSTLSVDGELNFHTIDIREWLSATTPTTQSRYTPDQLPGLDQRVHYAQATATLRASFVDVPGSPTRGHRTVVRFDYNQALDSDFSHLRLLALGEQFFELFYRRAIVLRLGTEWCFAPGNDRTPFYDLASLGGTESLRGYRLGRFRDRGTGFATATYKFPIWRLLEGALFYDTGRTFHDLSDLGFGEWKSTWGGSVRVWVPEGVVFEQMIARSPEETRLLFNFKTLF